MKFVLLSLVVVFLLFPRFGIAEGVQCTCNITRQQAGGTVPATLYRSYALGDPIPGAQWDYQGPLGQNPNSLYGNLSTPPYILEQYGTRYWPWPRGEAATNCGTSQPCFRRFCYRVNRVGPTQTVVRTVSTAQACGALSNRPINFALRANPELNGGQAQQLFAIDPPENATPDTCEAHLQEPSVRLPTQITCQSWFNDTYNSGYLQNCSRPYNGGTFDARTVPGNWYYNAASPNNTQLNLVTTDCRQTGGTQNDVSVQMRIDGNPELGNVTVDDLTDYLGRTGSCTVGGSVSGLYCNFIANQNTRARITFPQNNYDVVIKLPRLNPQTHQFDHYETSHVSTSGSTYLILDPTQYDPSHPPQIIATAKNYDVWVYIDHPAPLQANFAAGGWKQDRSPTSDYRFHHYVVELGRPLDLSTTPRTTYRTFRGYKVFTANSASSPHFSAPAIPADALNLASPNSKYTNMNLTLSADQTIWIVDQYQQDRTSVTIQTVNPGTVTFWSSPNRFNRLPVGVAPCVGTNSRTTCQLALPLSGPIFAVALLGSAIGNDSSIDWGYGNPPTTLHSASFNLGAQLASVTDPETNSFRLTATFPAPQVGPPMATTSTTPVPVATPTNTVSAPVTLPSTTPVPLATVTPVAIPATSSPNPSPTATPSLLTVIVPPTPVPGITLILVPPAASPTAPTEVMGPPSP